MEASQKKAESAMSGLKEQVQFVDGSYRQVSVESGVDVISPYIWECVYQQAACGTAEVDRAVMSSRNSSEVRRTAGPAARLMLRN